MSARYPEIDPQQDPHEPLIPEELPPMEPGWPGIIQPEEWPSHKLDFLIRNESSLHCKFIPVVEQGCNKLSVAVETPKRPCTGR